MPATNRQRELINMLNDLSQSISKNSLNTGVSIDLPGINVDSSVNLGNNGNNNCPTPPNTPQTIRDILMENLNNQVQLTTPFGVLTGTLIAVKDDYVVLIEANGDQTLVRIPKIESVNVMQGGM